MRPLEGASSLFYATRRAGHYCSGKGHGSEQKCVLDTQDVVLFSVKVTNCVVQRVAPRDITLWNPQPPIGEARARPKPGRTRLSRIELSGWRRICAGYLLLPTCTPEILLGPAVISPKVRRKRPFEHYLHSRRMGRSCLTPTGVKAHLINPAGDL